MPLLFPQDSSPLEKGTEVYYRFPKDVAHDPIKSFMQNMYDQCLLQGNELGFAKTLKSAVDRGFYKNRFAGLMATYLRRLYLRRGCSQLSWWEKRTIKYNHQCAGHLL